mgnify:CR=1 FL=1
MIKKITLLIIIILEFIVGGFFLYRYYHFAKKDPIVAELNSENIEVNTDSEFEYFWELKSYTIEVDQPDWLEEKAVYTYNNDGLNERYNYEIEKKEDVIRIIALGDSFTFGLFINTFQNWTELLEDELNNSTDLCPNKTFEVINLGVSGYDLPYITERYERKGKKYNPDLVVWFESNSGFFRNKELSEALVRECANNSSGVKLDMFSYGECYYQADKELEDKYGLDGLAKINNMFFEKFFKNADIEKTIFFGFESLSLSKDYTEALNLRLTTYPLMEFRKIIPDIWELDYLLLDGHPNKEGHETIKDAIFESIKFDLKEICF